MGSKNTRRIAFEREAIKTLQLEKESLGRDLNRARLSWAGEDLLASRISTINILIEKSKTEIKKRKAILKEQPDD